VLDTCIIVAAIRSRTGASFQLVDLATGNNDYIEPLLTTASLANMKMSFFGQRIGCQVGGTQILHALNSALLVPADWVKATYSYRPALLDAGDELVLEAAVNGQAKMIVKFNI
jgi:hypothetical protein